MSVYVINLLRRPDRRADIDKQLRSVGWSAQFFSAIDPPDAGKYPSKGCRGCTMSHLGVLRHARDRGLDRLTILEDDVNFVRDFNVRWEAALHFLEAVDWHIFYAGHILTGLRQGVSQIDPGLEVRQTHFLIVNGRDTITQLIAGLELFDSRAQGHPDGGPMPTDGAYSVLRRQNPDLHTYAHFPSLGYQRPSKTDISKPKWFDHIGALAPAVRVARKAKDLLRSPG